MEFKVGQVLNSRGRGIYGKMIAWRNGLIYDKGHNWTHSAIISEVKSDKVLVHEALTEGFICNYYEKWWLEGKIKEGVYIIGDVDFELKEVLKNARKYEGRGYGFLDIFHIVFYWIFGSKAKFLDTGAQHLICSEAVARILYDSSGKNIDFEKEFLIPYDLIEPMHLWRSKWVNWD
jgi:hypothetical protein